MSLKTTLQVLVASATLALAGCAPESNKYLEEEAIAALDATTETIGNMNSCSLRILNQNTAMVYGVPTTHLRESDVYLRGSDRLHIYTKLDDARKGFWYNGKELAVFRFDENIYDMTSTPPTTIAMIDSLHKSFKLDFPAADIFYPTLTDDIIAHFDSVFYLGTQEVDGNMCKTVNAINANLNVSLFIDDATNLPIQLAIYGRGDREGEYFISHYEDWQVNPILGDEIFEFSPPASASKAAIFKKD